MTTQERKVMELALEALEDRASLMKWQMARDAVKEALAQPEQEPVAWIRKTDITELTDCEPEEDGYTPLYTIPPQRTWVGLTDEEAHELWESTDSDDDWELMKRTEAKLKEKNA